jgi:TusA-related sulfurtransferase
VSASDLPAWCQFTGNELLEQSDEGDVFRFVVRKVA